MESWERTILKWWVEEEVPVKWAMNEQSERKENGKGGVMEAVARRDSR